MSSHHDWDIDHNIINIENNVLYAEDLLNEPNPNGLGIELFTTMSEAADQTAQICGDTDTVDTYGYLLKRCIRVALEMQDRGISRKNVIIVCTRNHINSCVPYLATLFLGAKVSALDASLSIEDMKYLVSLVNPTMIFADVESKVKLEKVRGILKIDYQIISFNNIDAEDSFKMFLKEKDNEENFVPNSISNINDTAVIFFSSGTTGLPKAMCLSHRALMGQCKNYVALHLSYSVTLCFASLYWCIGAMLIFTSICTKTCRLIYERFNLSLVWNSMRQYHVTMLLLTPYQVIQMIQAAGSGSSVDIHSVAVECVVISGATISSHHFERMKRLLPKADICCVYGLTEIGGIATTFRPNNPDDVKLMKAKGTSCGKPIWGISCRVVDLKTKATVGPNVTGELRLKTKFQLSGYYGNKEAEIWDEFGWLITGDLCYYDNDYCFHIVDRIKDLIKYKTWHVLPAVLETVLMMHPNVKEAVVVGVPHRDYGEQPMAVVALINKQDNTTAQEILNFVNARVDDKYRLRGGVKIVSSLPTTPSMKLKRKAIKDITTKEMGNRK